jgi:hypothetical protein
MKLPDQIQPLIGQIQRNPRLQLGLGLIVVTILIWLFLVLGDWRESRISVLEASNHRLEQTRNLARQKNWAERAAEARQIAELLDSEIPRAASPGLAQAEFQGWLRQVADAQPTALRLEVQPALPMDVPAGFVRITASLNGSMTPSQVIGLISRIESRQNLATIPMMTVRSDGRNRSFSMTIHGYYKLQPAEVML